MAQLLTRICFVCSVKGFCEDILFQSRLLLKY